MKKTLFLFLLLLPFGCKNSGNPGTEQAIQNDTIQVKTEKFILPEIPALITEPERRFEFLIEHYWDHFNFSDTAYVPSADITEQAWVDYVDLLRRAPLDKAKETLRGMMLKSARGDKKLFLYFTEMADKYLSGPNSPARNEELYIPVLEVMIQTPVLNNTEKMLPEHRLKKAHQNRVGTQALDFRYTDIAGKSGTLYRINAEYLLLFFNEPGCPSCREHIESISHSVIMNWFLSNHGLQILSIYADNNRDEWKKHYGSYPSGWINGYDPSSAIEEKYDLKAIPTFYLLDKNKNVLLKDAPLGEIEKYLMILK